ncbi:Transcriptional activator of proteases prtT [Penicillium maclennaniae]|uniref:Transcriptional activator of proteases prtT n=1 Tax=Penicillium maclennaniae TaxID=1343394 RepID=UPI00254206A3|nr:Transcriptional activator of proteases prtT [Penicillium maclennaniae]KAJ5661781.1 Transcriptional activator of proteases prtT [Penicillium maclennaniae]
MTRTEPAHSNMSWETKSIAATDDGNRIESVGQDNRPRGRIRRSMTACNTCRKLKTRCDLDPRGHACRRCLSLRLECELPETQDRFFQDNVSTWSEANAAIPSIEERLVSLERGMGEMINLMRQMANQSSNASGSPNSHVARSLDDSSSEHGQVPSFSLKPVQLIRDLQMECFNGRDNYPTDVDLLGDIVSQGIIDAKLSLKLIELFVEYFGPWVSIDLSSGIQRTDTLLFNTACLLASRYLPGMPSNTVHEISLQVQHAVTKALWRKTPLSNDSLQALALLCLYPTSSHKEGFMDGWLLSGISINHALLSFTFLNQPFDKSILSDETLSALGYGRSINVQPQYLDLCTRILDHPRATSEDGRILAEIQLYRIAMKLQNNPHRLRFVEPEYEEIERWKMEWAHLLSKGPLSASYECSHLNKETDNEGSSTLELSLWFSQLLLHRTATRLQPESDRLAPEICSNARLIISRSLQTRFSAAPGLIDNVYYILGYAALTLCDYNPSDPLIDQVRSFLLHLAPNSDHIAYRIAYVVSEVQRRYGEASDPTSPAADVMKSNLFAAPRTANIDLSTLIPAGSMETLVEGYACFDHLMPTEYVPPQPTYQTQNMFQPPTHPTGGSMPVALVPRMIHDF